MDYTQMVKGYEGEVVDITDGSVTIDIQGRLGKIEVPKRMVISEEDINVGQKVQFKMSYIQINSKVKEDHVSELKAY